MTVARRQLALSNWDERAHRRLMLALAKMGQRNETLAQYDRCFEILQTELGVEPSDETVALYEQIVTGIVNTMLPTEQIDNRFPQPVT